MAVTTDVLFELASSLAQFVGAPITIEDENSVMLAYSSGGAQTVDEARIATILGRRVPGRYGQMLTDAGVFDRLRRESLGGSIWAAVTAPPTADQVQAMRASASPVAGRIVRERDRAAVNPRSARAHMMSRSSSPARAG